MIVDKENIVELPDQRAVDEQAANWLMCFEDGDLSVGDKAAFFAWRDASEANNKAFKRLAALWGGFDRINELDDYAEAALKGDGAARSSSRVGFSRTRMLVAIAATLLLSVGVGVVMFYSAPLSGVQAGLFATSIGEQRTIDLKDGSIIDLNTNSEIKVVMSDTARIMNLNKGEAYFDVARDESRPFTVRTPNGEVTALGTAFAVRVSGGRLDVLVAEGRVGLSSDSARPGEPARTDIELAAGERVMFSGAVEHAETIEPADVARKLLWREGVLAFSGEPLSAVVADVSRYTDIMIKIEDQEIRDVPVIGYFRTGDIEELFEALEIMADLEVEIRGPKSVLLKKPSDDHEG